jgi:hypothetical protein
VKQTLIDLFNFQRGYLSLLIDDIPDEKMAEQPKGLPNHPAWQIGHLTMALDGLCKMLGAESSLDDAFVAKFTMGSEPVDDRSKYPSKTELLSKYDELRAKAAEAYANASDADLAKPNPSEILGKMLPTMGHMAAFMMLDHESNHLGQISIWRQAAGMRPALEALIQPSA